MMTSMSRPRSQSSSELSTDAATELRWLERRLVGQPHEILGISRDASNSEACMAYVVLAEQYHPRRFAEFDAPVVRRAAATHRRLRATLTAFLRQREALVPPFDPSDDRAVTQRFVPMRRLSA